MPRLTKDHITYRTEIKYLCSEADLRLLESKIEHIVARDSHVKQAGAYNVRSVYFDDMYNTCYNQVEEGVDNRSKYRIRIYNCDKSEIKLEEKKKYRGKSYKNSCNLTFEQCQMLLNSQQLLIPNDAPLVLQRLCTAVNSQLMHPCIIVDYQRTPFVYPLGNVRITFDRYISSSSYIKQFFNQTLPLRPIMESGKHILEVKFDEFFIDYLHHTLQLYTLNQTSFSKYYLCRKFSIGGSEL